MSTLIQYDHQSSAGILDSSSSGIWMQEQSLYSYGDGEISKANAKTRTPKSGSNKTRRNVSPSRVVQTSALTDDGYGWRKYGQKNIQNKPYPRSYYICTNHKDIEKCKAKKWVQQVSQDPPIYRTTYLGHHTCKNPLKIPHIMLPYDSSYISSSSDDLLLECSDHNSSKSFLLCFDSPNASHNEHISSMGSAASLLSSPSSSAADLIFPDDEAMNDMSSMQVDCQENGSYYTSAESESFAFPLSTETPYDFDFDFDFEIDSYDLAMMAEEWSKC